MENGNLAATLAAIAAKRGWSASRAYLAGDDEYTYAERLRGSESPRCWPIRSGHASGRPRPHRAAGRDRPRLELSRGPIPRRSRSNGESAAAIARARDRGRALRPTLVVCDGSLLETFHGLPAFEPARLVREPDSVKAVRAHTCLPAEPACALFTSGTTGEPRLCFHKHGDALIYDQAFGRPRSAYGPAM